MARNLRALGIAVVAMLAMAVAASVAQAQTPDFRLGTGAGTGVVTVEQDPQSPIQTFITDVGAVECEEFHGEGMGNATTQEITLDKVAYEECNLGGLFAEVNFGTCDYKIHANGAVDLEPAGCEVEINVPAAKCVVTVPGGQTFPAGTLTYTNVQTSGKPKEITAHANANAIEYEWAGASCPVATSGSDDNGIYEGTLTARGFDTPTPAGAGTQTDLVFIP